MLMVMEDQIKIFMAGFDKWRRIKPRKSQKELASVINVSQPTISDYFKGEYSPDLDTIQEWIRHYGLDYEEILNLGRQELCETKGPLQQAFRRLERANSRPLLLDQKIEEPIPFDPAVALLNECLKEAGAELNKKQKEAIVRIIRKYQNQAKEEVADIIEAFK